MHILTPLNSIEAMYRLHEAGADEFYIGFSDELWTEKFGKFRDLNRLSSYGGSANQRSPYEVFEYVSKAHELGAALYVTFNAASYDDEQLEWIDVYMKTAAEAGADGAIVSTPEQVILAQKNGIPAVASTMCSVYNSEIAKFYRDLGVKRIILPRELTLDTIEEIVREIPDMEYEVFLMRNGCRYSDSYCLGMHAGDCGGLCYDQGQKAPVIHMSGEFSYKKWNELEYNNYLYDNLFHNNACGQCALWRLSEIGITAAKIVGRMDDAESVASDVELTRYNLAVAENSESEQEYLMKMSVPENRYEYCRSGMSCYYPEVRYGK